MEYKKYIEIIRKRLWLVILMPLVFSLASAYISFFVQQPVYESNLTMYIMYKTGDQKARMAYDDMLISQNLVKDYTELIKSRLITKTVISDLRLTDLTPKELEKNIKVSLKNDTRIIEIRVQDKNPVRARNIADKLGDVFSRDVVELMKAESVNIVDSAETPDTPVRPRHLINITAAFFIGLVLSWSTAFFLEYIDNTIKTAEDVEKHLGLSVLATIPVLENL